LKVGVRMNVLEKILEEIDNMEMVHVNYRRDNFRDGFASGAKKCCEIVRSYMLEKEKVSSAEIISRNIDGKPYYGIKFKKVGEDDYTVGYGSYKLENVIEWLNECFEFCGEVKASVNVAKDTNVLTDEDWIPVEERLPDRGIYVLCCFDDGTADVLWQNWKDDKSLLLYADIDNQIRKVIAWQRLPEPYKPKKDIEDSGARS